MKELVSQCVKMLEYAGLNEIRVIYQDKDVSYQRCVTIRNDGTVGSINSSGSFIECALKEEMLHAAIRELTTRCRRKAQNIITKRLIKNQLIYDGLDFIANNEK